MTNAGGIHSLVLESPRGRGAEIIAPVSVIQIHRASSTVGADTNRLRAALEEVRSPTPTFAGTQPLAGSLDRRIYDTLASFKIFTSQIAMHLDDAWRARLFRQLDSLLDTAEWDERDLPPTLASFGTFLRFILVAKPQDPPGLGATSDGRVVATWTRGSDRLTLDFFPADQARWSVSVGIDGETERAAGFVPIGRVMATLEPYGPARWFNRA